MLYAIIILAENYRILSHRKFSIIHNIVILRNKKRKNKTWWLLISSSSQQKIIKNELGVIFYGIPIEMAKIHTWQK